jgi:hypothetical protein
MRGAAYQLFLLLSGVKKHEAILKASAIPDFSFQFERLSCPAELQLQFNNFAERDLARDGSAQSAFSNIFGASMLRFFGFYDQPQIQKKSRMGSRQTPGLRLSVFNGHGLQTYHTVSTAGIT